MSNSLLRGEQDTRNPMICARVGRKVLGMKAGIVALGIILAVRGVAQTQLGAMGATTENEISARLAGQPLVLRGFWAADALEFDTDGRPVKSYAQTSFTLAAFEETGAKFEGNRLVIDGKRVGLIFKDHLKPSRVTIPVSKKDASPERVTITIDGGPGADFSKALDTIFAARLRDIVETLPSYWQTFARKNILLEDTPPSRMPADDATAPNHVGGDVKPPKLVKQSTPSFNEAARRLNYSGDTEVYLVAEADGKPSHISILKPIGLGLDEEAVAATSRYVFKPATKDGTPVRVDLYVDVNFQIY